MFGFINQWIEHRKARKAARLDAMIQQEVKRQLQADQYLRDRNLQVMVKDGIVTLTGTLTSPLQKELAEDIALRVPGAREVQDNLELGIGQPVGNDLEENVSPGDVIITKTADMGSFNLHQPSATPINEVQPRSPFEEPGTVESGVVVENTLQPIPMTGESDGVIEAVHPLQVSSGEVEEDMAIIITPGMGVVDVEGNKVGVVKTVQPTNFLINRTLARDIYVPYFACSCDGQQVTLQVHVDQIYDQGWAQP